MTVCDQAPHVGKEELAATVAVRRLPLVEVQLTTNFRRQLDVEHVRTLAEYDGEYPPILVSWPDRRVIDGLHRVQAAKLQSKTYIACELFTGSETDEYVEFVRRNVVHGLPLALSERKAAARRILHDVPDYSDRRIAGICGLSAGVVARIRATVPDADTSVRTGRDGRSRPVDSREMRCRIGSALQADSTASLQTIAARVGASPETVRSVRRQLMATKGTPATIEAGEDAQSPAAGQGAPRPMASNISPIGVSSRRHSTNAGATDWTSDTVLNSTGEGLAFAEWFTKNAIEEVWQEYLTSIPLGKIYEIADEARRRSSLWSDFAREVEERARSNRALS